MTGHRMFMERNKKMSRNESNVDRVLRVVLGLVLLSLVFVGPQTPWGLIGWCRSSPGSSGSAPCIPCSASAPARRRTDAGGAGGCRRSGAEKEHSDGHGRNRQCQRQEHRQRREDARQPGDQRYASPAADHRVAGKVHRERQREVAVAQRQPDRARRRALEQKSEAVVWRKRRGAGHEIGRAAHPKRGQHAGDSHDRQYPAHGVGQHHRQHRRNIDERRDGGSESGQKGEPDFRARHERQCEKPDVSEHPEHQGAVHPLFVFGHDVEVQRLFQQVCAPGCGEDHREKDRYPQRQPEGRQRRRRDRAPAHPDGAGAAGGVVEPAPVTLSCRVQYQRRVVQVPANSTSSPITVPYQTTVWGASGQIASVVKWTTPSSSHVRYSDQPKSQYVWHMADWKRPSRKCNSSSSTSPVSETVSTVWNTLPSSVAPGSQATSGTARSGISSFITETVAAPVPMARTATAAAWTTELIEPPKSRRGYPDLLDFRTGICPPDRRKSPRPQPFSTKLSWTKRLSQ